jgi:inhibitor of cysteine peptidase
MNKKMKNLRKLTCIGICVIFCLLSFGTVQAHSDVGNSTVLTDGHSMRGSNIIYLNEYSDGSKVVMGLGDYLFVDLPTNPSTGYDWHLEELDQGIVAFRGKYYYGFSGLYGSPCRVVWQFQAVSLGATKLVMKYYRIWEGPGSAIDTYILGITVVKRLIYLDEHDDGSWVWAHLGDYIAVDLPTNPSTGYDWHLEKLDQRVVAFRGKYYYGFSGLYGSPGRVVWLFKVIGYGRTDLVLKYYRIWEGPSNAIDTYTLHITVLFSNRIQMVPFAL